MLIITFLSISFHTCALSKSNSFGFVLAISGQRYYKIIIHALFFETKTLENVTFLKKITLQMIKFAIIDCSNRVIAFQNHPYLHSVSAW